jgi:hypothetical protein
MSTKKLTEKLTENAKDIALSTPQGQAAVESLNVANKAVKTATGAVSVLTGALTKGLNIVNDYNKEIQNKSNEVDSIVNGQSQTQTQTQTPKKNGGAKKLNKVAVLMKKAAEKLPSLSDINNKSLKNKVKTAKKKLLKASHKAKQASKKIMKLIKGGRRRSSSSKRR